MIYLVSATVDDLSRVSGIRRGEKEALKLALTYYRQGYKEIQITSEDAVYSLEQFRRLVE